jgi:hypothetical protein
MFIRYAHHYFRDGRKMFVTEHESVAAALAAARQKPSYRVRVTPDLGGVGGYLYEKREGRMHRLSPRESNTWPHLEK